MVPFVKQAIANMLRNEGVGLMICSAACGADLLALAAAYEAGIRCRIILPFERTRFRQTSVIDRPGNWEVLFDRIVSLVDDKGDLVVIREEPSKKRAYQQANELIVQEASAAPNARRLAVLVWEGRPRLKDDLTAEFLRLANSAGLLVRTIPTLSS
jgi:hypothetical protein